MYANWKVYVSCLSSFISAVDISLIMFYPSPAFPDINLGNYGFKIPTIIASWLAGFSGLFAIPGALIAVLLMDHFGRKFVFVVSNLPSAIGWLLILASYDVITLAIGRVLTGLSLGMFACGTIYGSEISLKETRGLIIMLDRCCICLGGFIINLLGAFINWRYLALVGLATTAAATVLTLFMYETPRWLVSKGHQQIASTVMTKLWNIRDPDEISKQIQIIESDLTLVPKSHFFKKLLQLVKPPLWKPLLITQLLLILYQFCGYAYVTNFTVAIFREAKISIKTTNPFINNSNYQSAFIFLANIFGSFLSMLFIDRLGRRPLLILSGISVTVSLIPLGIYYYLKPMDYVTMERLFNWLPLLCLMLYMTGMSLGLSSIPYLLLNELFPQSVRAVAVGVGTFNQFVCYFIVVKVFSALNGVPLYTIFWIFSAVAFLSVLFVILFVPETKDCSLEEIQMRWYKPKIRNLTAELSSQSTTTDIIYI